MTTLRHIAFSLSRTFLRAPLIWARHRGLDEADVLLASYPRSGNTWFRFMLGDVLGGPGSGFDNVDDMVPQIGLHERAQSPLPGHGRVIKTHELHRREYKKAIYLVRDIRDVMISLYSRGSRVGVFDRISFDEFLPRFLAGRSTNTGSWQSHVRSWLTSPLSQDGRLLVVRYEEARRDPEAILSNVLQFLGFEVQAENVRRAVQANTLEQMKSKELRSHSFPQSRDEQGRFVRQGAIEGWRGRLSEEQLRLVQLYAGEEMALAGYSMECPKARIPD